MTGPRRLPGRGRAGARRFSAAQRSFGAGALRRDPRARRGGSASLRRRHPAGRRLRLVERSANWSPTRRRPRAPQGRGRDSTTTGYYQDRLARHVPRRRQERVARLARIIQPDLGAAWRPTRAWRCGRRCSATATGRPSSSRGSSCACATVPAPHSTRRRTPSASLRPQSKELPAARVSFSVPVWYALNATLVDEFGAELAAATVVFEAREPDVPYGPRAAARADARTGRACPSGLAQRRLHVARLRAAVRPVLLVLAFRGGNEIEPASAVPAKRSRRSSAVL